MFNVTINELDSVLEAFNMADSGFSRAIHDLRSSLTSVRSLSEILHDYPNINGNKRKEFLDIIVQEAERMARIITQADASFQTLPNTVTQIPKTNITK
jgi:signal transduction histidine kinase